MKNFLKNNWKLHKIFFIIVFLILILLLSSIHFFINTKTIDNYTIKEKSNSTFIIQANEDIYGSSTSNITIIEYYDLECPYCKKLHEALLQNKELLNEVRYVYRPFPLVGIHSGAGEKNIALFCARDQDKSFFLKGMNYAYDNLEISTSSYTQFFKSKVVSPDTFSLCLEKPEQREIINNIASKAIIDGIFSTPSLVFVINNYIPKVFNYVGATQGIRLIKEVVKSQSNH